MPKPIWRPDNKGLAEAVKGQPRFIGCCQVNPQFGQEAVDELEAGITQWGLRSLKLMPTAHNYDIAGSLPVPVREISSTLGRPDVKIVDSAREVRAGLVVMGAFGRNRITEYFLGSNAAAVVRSSSIAVLVAR